MKAYVNHSFYDHRVDPVEKKEILEYWFDAQASPNGLYLNSFASIWRIDVADKMDKNQATWNID